MTHKLDGKTILITAAGSGMGKASAIACANEGANVIATDIDKAALDLLVDENTTIKTRVLDVRNGEAIDKLAAEFPQLDGLFNCAGIVHHGTILDLSDEVWANNFDINITSIIRMCRAFIPGMLERAEVTGSVSILNMASMASSIKGFVNRAAYGSTKAAVIGLTKSIAIDFVGQGIRCNALCPGTVDTPSLRGRIAQADDPVQAEKDFIARQPVGRLASVDDITPLVTYLLSDESGFVTGQAMLVDGGVTI
jgi:2-keto-3-deoxy-L-fuconate dehydrogenase